MKNLQKCCENCPTLRNVVGPEADVTCPLVASGEDVVKLELIFQPFCVLIWFMSHIFLSLISVSLCVE